MDSPAMEQTEAYYSVPIRRIWQKFQLEKKGQIGKQLNMTQWRNDVALMDQLGLGLEQWVHYVYQAESLHDFEQWIQINSPTLRNNHSGQASGLQLAQNRTATDADTLTPEQRYFFEEHGYLVIPGVIDAAQCRDSSKAIWDFLGKHPEKPDTWYSTTPNLQGIMVQLFQNPVLERNRQSERLKRIYQTLWGCRQLTVSTDRAGFNPPETDNWRFPGPYLHWDLGDFKPPVPFGLQGMLYLTDTDENQGAFTCVPGFHRKIDQWLETLPEGANPQEYDLYSLGAKPIAANAGDFILWHHALPHGSSPNTGKTPRIVQYINMYPAPAYSAN